MTPPAEPRIRVLVIADSCNPEWESIPLVGWSHANALREVADVHIVTRSWNAPALLRAGLLPGRDFTAIDTEALFQPDGAPGPPHQRAEQGLGHAHRARHPVLPLPRTPDVAPARRRPVRAAGSTWCTRITPLSPAVPSLIDRYCRRAGIPFVLGPLNGGLPWPACFPGLRRQEGEWLSHLRGAYRLLPGLPGDPAPGRRDHGRRRQRARRPAAALARQERLRAGKRHRAGALPGSAAAHRRLLSRPPDPRRVPRPAGAIQGRRHADRGRRGADPRRPADGRDHRLRPRGSAARHAGGAAGPDRPGGVHRQDLAPCRGRALRRGRHPRLPQRARVRRRRGAGGDGDGAGAGGGRLWRAGRAGQRRQRLPDPARPARGRGRQPAADAGAHRAGAGGAGPALGAGHAARPARCSPGPPRPGRRSKSIAGCSGGAPTSRIPAFPSPTRRPSCAGRRPGNWPISAAPCAS